MDTEQRLARLETSNRRLRGWLRAGLLAGAALVLIGASAPQTVDLLQTRRLQIVDSTGRPVVMIGEDAGQGFAAFFDSAGKPKVQISSASVGGQIYLKAAGGADLVVIGPGEQGAGTMVTYTATGNEHVKLGTTYEGAGAVTTFRNDGSRLIQLTANTNGDGLMATFAPGGRVRASWP